ncbi:unnamed protein product [Anisakis simplex]|uniref:Uncharacterized protein n=1 Tax=Anisakis simplex TaxID=6269 RepID=A0A0M3JP70_ANISI|nr:unnamed protein product [Anisakis simplex]
MSRQQVSKVKTRKLFQNRKSDVHLGVYLMTRSSLWKKRIYYVVRDVSVKRC